MPMQMQASHFPRSKSSKSGFAMRMFPCRSSVSDGKGRAERGIEPGIVLDAVGARAVEATGLEGTARR